MIFPFFPVNLFTPDKTDTKTKPSVNIYIDDRDRFERHINPTFFDAPDKNRSDLYSRLRIGVNYDNSPEWNARIEYQNSGDVFWTQAQNNSTNSSDLSLAYGKYTSGTFIATGGRQKIDLGEQRLIGSADWLNLARSFDAARVPIRANGTRGAAKLA